MRHLIVAMTGAALVVACMCSEAYSWRGRLFHRRQPAYPCYPTFLPPAPLPCPMPPGPPPGQGGLLPGPDESPMTMDDPPSRLNLLTGQSRIRFTDFHAIFIFDTNGLNSPAKDFGLLNSVFEVFSRDHNRDLQGRVTFVAPPTSIISDQVVLTGDDVTRAKIFRTIDEMSTTGERRRRIKPDDVVFLWADTEGVFEGGKHFLTLSNGDRIDRDDLRRRLEFRDGAGRQGNRLTVLITDNCSETKAGQSNPLNAAGASVWKSLYFGHKGTVDIVSSTPPQKAFASGESVFSRAFVTAFNSFLVPKQELDRNGDGFIDWKLEFFPRMREETQKTFREKLAVYFDEGTGARTEAYNKLEAGDRAIVDEMNQQKTQTPELLPATSTVEPRTRNP